MPAWIEILVILLLIIANGLLVMAEIPILSAHRLFPSRPVVRRAYQEEFQPLLT